MLLYRFLLIGIFFRYANPKKRKAHYICFISTECIILWVTKLLNLQKLKILNKWPNLKKM